MLKRILVGFVVLCGSSAANAGLLVNYSFSGTNGDSSFTPAAGDYGPTGAVAPGPTSFATILSAGAFTNQGPAGNGNPGSIDNSAWVTSGSGATSIATLPNASRGNQLTLAPISGALGEGLITIESMQFNMGKTAAGNGNLINLQVYFQPTPTSALVELGTGVSLGTTQLNPNTITFANPIVLNKDSSVGSFRFVWSRTENAGANSGQARLDDVSFFGTYTAVPEPASVAVLGSLAAVALLGRHRRKSSAEERS